MATDTQAQGHQEGSRWINKRPTGKEVADWFMTNAPMHPGMDAKDYVTGVVLIPAKEKTPSGERMTYTPYAKVETRIAYFWRYVSTIEGAVGSIEPADTIRLETEGVYNMNLPPGFFRLPVQDQTGKFVHFLCCSMQVRVRDANGKDLMRPPTGTKMVSSISKWGVDENALMKAETGAVGRALGMAGMLVLPGSGVATAEDMQEMAAAEERPSVAVELPAQGDSSASLAQQIQEVSQQLQTDFPGRFEEFEAWAREKKVDLADVRDHQLRGVLRYLEKKLAEPSAS